MAKAELKTKLNNASALSFINSVQDPQQREDSLVLIDLMGKLSGEQPKMWGDSIVGFGLEQLKYASGRELEWFKIGFSPRKNSLTLYVLRSSEDAYGDLFKQLGKHSLGKGCLYIKKLADVDLQVLQQVIAKSLTL